jgi:hypothetical protein
MTEKDITALYYCIDEFCKIYETWERMRLIPRLGRRRREGKLSLSEKLFIITRVMDKRCFYSWQDFSKQE